MAPLVTNRHHYELKYRHGSRIGSFWSSSVNVFMGTGDPKMSAFKVVPLHFGITSGSCSTSWNGPRQHYELTHRQGSRIGSFRDSSVNVFIGTGDPKMSAFKVVPLHFGITSGFCSTSRNESLVTNRHHYELKYRHGSRIGSFWSSSVNVFMGTGDPKMNAFKVVPLHFGITSGLCSTSRNGPMSYQ